MEQIPSCETTIHSGSQISRLLWHPKVQYGVHKNQPVVPIWSQKNPVQPYILVL
jgi:hypothetical protein